jgi:hypothetical protein
MMQASNVKLSNDLICFFSWVLIFILILILWLYISFVY